MREAIGIALVLLGAMCADGNSLLVPVIFAGIGILLLRKELR